MRRSTADRNGKGGGDETPSPFRRSYKHKCPIPECGLGFGSKRRVCEHLENVHGIWPKDGVYTIPRKRVT